ncbi:MAG: hypothetical protein LBJ31_06280 [Treponema sp.]|jgi:nucleoside 2-deoxyribosyltransferase|nr:hypothetical protein [Treponema sp.]
MGSLLPMESISLFGISWENEFSNHHSGHFNINHLTNKEVGDIYFTQNALQNIDCAKENYYKALSIIFENHLNKKFFFICLENERVLVKESIIKPVLICTLEELLSEFPQNIVEIQSRILLMLYIRIPKYGQHLGKICCFEFFAEDEDELRFILDSMFRKNWIEYNNQDDDLLGDSRLLINQNGWMEIEKNITQKYSKQCFIAMNFAEGLKKASECIKKAIIDTGFSPLRIDEKYHNNEISGEILFEIKKSHFIIADETGQKNGVYFEAGYALGNGKDVIWCCKESDLASLHFDTRQYNHIVWKDENDLYKKLKDRILGTIVVKEN